ncbi:PT domain-containing protein [Kribbella sp. NPDC049174]|uniref:PT domain-containing protein n=1 Tax=Kribbella sp. NPDC049174 TaxID=3364112 RepID=UPI0037111B49
MVGGGVALVMLVVAAVFMITSGDDKKAGPDPTPTNQPTGSQPTNQPTGESTTKPGQSKNPKLHEGGRISSDAISFPRQNPPWSDRKRLVAQLLNSSGQYVLLQENFDGKNDWYADIFVGALGTGSGFNGDPKATAAALSIQLRNSMYGDIPVTFKTVSNGAVKRSDKSGWYFQQTVTAKSTKLTARVLTLTVAVFDLGDGTAVAYISDIPTNRPDLRAAESQAYKGINVG